MIPRATLTPSRDFRNQLARGPKTIGSHLNPGIKIQLELLSDIDDVVKFVYLGATVTTTGGAGEDLSVRLGKALFPSEGKGHDDDDDIWG